MLSKRLSRKLKGPIVYRYLLAFSLKSRVIISFQNSGLSFSRKVAQQRITLTSYLSAQH